MDVQGFAKVTWASDNGTRARVELFSIDLVCHKAKRADYEPIIKEFGGWYNEKTQTATIKGTPYQVAKFVEDYKGFSQVACYIEC